MCCDPHVGNMCISDEKTGSCEECRQEAADGEPCSRLGDASANHDECEKGDGAEKNSFASVALFERCSKGRPENEAESKCSVRNDGDLCVEMEGSDSHGGRSAVY